MPEYTRRDGAYNLTSKLPAGTLPPDLGPKMYVAYGSASPAAAAAGTTPLHMDMPDAVNVWVYVETDSGAAPAPTATGVEVTRVSPPAIPAAPRGAGGRASRGRVHSTPGRRRRAGAPAGGAVASAYDLEAEAAGSASCSARGRARRQRGVGHLRRRRPARCGLPVARRA